MKPGALTGLRGMFGLLVLLASWSAGAAAAELRNLAFYQDLSDKEITDLFHDTVFGSEDPTVGKLRKGTVRKHVKPIRYFVVREGGARFTPLEMMLENTADIFPAVPISAANKLGNANLRVFLLADRDRMVKKAIEIWGKDISKEQRRFIRESPCVAFLDYQGMSSRVRRSTVLISLAARDYHAECAYEEVIQALGPINDSRMSAKTMMNDASNFAQIPLIDLYVANMLYDPAIKPGMTKKQIGKVLPDVLARTKQKLAPLTQIIRP